MQLTGVVALILVVIAIIILRAIIHIVPQFQRLVVFSFGRFQGMYGPGLVIIAPPPIQTVAQTIDLREFVVEIPQQTCITQDNAPSPSAFLSTRRSSKGRPRHQSWTTRTSGRPSRATPQQ